MHKPNNLLELDVQEEFDWDPMLDDARIVVSADDGRRHPDRNGSDVLRRDTRH